MKNRSHFLLKILSFTSLILISVPHQVSAQTAELNIGISPPLTHIIIQPGKTALTTVTVENQGFLDVNLTPNFVDFVSDDKSGVPVLLDTMSFPHISLQDVNVQMNNAFLLKPGEKRQLVFEVIIPENSFEKEYHFSLVFDVKPEQGVLADTNSAGVSGQIVTNYIVTVSQSAKDQGLIELQAFEGPLFVDSLAPITTRVFMQNSGKNTTVTIGELRITDVFGAVVFKQELLPENILPGSIREVFGAEIVTKDGEEFKTQTPLRYKNFFLIGPYTLTLTYHAPGQQEQVFTHRVFALPISIMIFIVIAYILYLIYAKTSLLRLDRNKQNDHTNV